MRKFKVLKCPKTKTFNQLKSRRDKNDNLVYYTVYSEIKVGDVKPGRKDRWYPSAYGVEGIEEGQVIELDGHFADKAAANPDFEEVFEEVKRKPGRPKKVKDAA